MNKYLNHRRPQFNDEWFAWCEQVIERHRQKVERVMSDDKQFSPELTESINWLATHINYRLLVFSRFASVEDDETIGHKRFGRLN
jgi:hypothetical protein